MPLTSGTRLGPYEILSAIGAGGMGEVYKAHDTKLDRDVAIKILPDPFVSDPERVARFQREAKTLASLNHPHIGGIYGLEESGGVTALVMELVQGEDLSQRIARGPIPIDDALPIAKQIAEALEAAHEQGIIHRDLKPANIKVRADGTVKVLDFGLAKALDREGSGPTVSQSPTITSPAHMTQAGILLGTTAYMSPEQAAGKAVDKRTDLWAFGVVFLEMLTGQRVFHGETVSHVIASVLKDAPDWTTLPANTPVPIRKLLRRCLEKERTRRLDSAAAARLEIDDALAPSAETTTSAVMSIRRLAFLVVASLAAGALAASLAIWVMMRPSTDRAAQEMRFAILPPASQTLMINGGDRDLALSPDGSHLAYVSGTAAGTTQLMVRALNQLDAVALPGVTGIRSPFISPDGQWVGFFAGTVSGELKKVSIAGGPSISLCRFVGAPRGASWGDDGTIVFATSDPTRGLLSVSAAGGEPGVLTNPDVAHGEQYHLFPSFLPGGQAVLFTIAAAGNVADMQVAVLDLKTGQRKNLIRGGGYAEYGDRSATGTTLGQPRPEAAGYLVYAVVGTLRAVRFDPNRLEVLSDPVPVVDHVMTMPNGAAEFSLSRQGALVYVMGSGLSGAARSLVWVDRRGQEAPINAPPRAYALPRISPDGTQVALDIRDQGNDIWIWNLVSETLKQLTFDTTNDWFPVWTPDAQRIIFSSARAGVFNLFSQRADNTGVADRLTISPHPQFPTSVSRDGKHVLFFENVPNTSLDVEMLRMEDDTTTSTAEPISRQIEHLVHTEFAEMNGELSPDGHWLAYESNESGQSQIHVRPFPSVESGHWTISTGGGSKPVWARSGQELFYLDGSNAMTAVPIQTTPTFTFGNSLKLFEGKYYAAALPGRTYDVSPDSKRFLMIKDPPRTSSSAPAQLVLVLNWTAELARLVRKN